MTVEVGLGSGERLPLADRCGMTSLWIERGLRFGELASANSFVFVSD